MTLSKWISVRKYQNFGFNKTMSNLQSKQVASNDVNLGQWNYNDIARSSSSSSSSSS